jgi:hypothetical protein
MPISSCERSTRSTGLLLLTELEEQPKSEAAAHISGWVMAAFAEIDPISVSDLDYILQRQNAAYQAMFSNPARRT